MFDITTVREYDHRPRSSSNTIPVRVCPEEFHLLITTKITIVHF